MVTRRQTAYSTMAESSRKGRSMQGTVPYNKIAEPGTYYFHPTGMLFRVPSEGICPGHSPLINICWTDECYCTKISDDPWVPISKARLICANSGFVVNF